MKPFLSTLLLLLTFVGNLQAQGVDVASDTSNANRPRSGRTRISVPGGRLATKGSTGNATLYATLPEVNVRLPFAVAAAEFTALGSTPPLRMQYDGSTWERQTGAITANGGTTLAGPAGFWYLRKYVGAVNAGWFGAKGDGNTNETSAINATLDWIRVQVAAGYGVFRPTMKIPAGHHRTQGLNATNLNGICIIGDGGSYLNTTLIGIGTGAIVDFTGSSQAKLFDISLISNSNETQASPIAVLLALGQVSASDGTLTGGLNCTLRNIYVQMDDMPTANGGLGSVGIMNCRSEEVAYSDGLIQCNTPVVFTNKRDVTAELGFTVASNYATVAAGFNSMTVIDMSGNMSLRVVNRRSNAIVAVNTGALVFNGYATQYNGGTGSVKTAFRLIGQAQDMSFRGVVEGFSTIARYAQLNNSLLFHMTAANQQDNTLPVFDWSDVITEKDGRITMVFPVLTDINSRTFLYQPPTNGGNTQSPSSIANGKYACSDWVNNATFISPHLLKVVGNTEFLTGQSFAVQAGSVVDLKTYNIPLGTILSNNGEFTGTIIKFRKADKATTTSGNAGLYRAKVRGTITAGDYSATGRHLITFEATVTQPQNADGSLGAQNSEVLILSNMSTNPTYVTLYNLVVQIDMANTGEGSVRVYLKSTGTATGQPVYYSGNVEVFSDFAVNRSVIYN